MERGVTAAVAGGTLRGRQTGTGPPLLLLHGGPGLEDYTGPLADELAASFEVVHYQQRGLDPSVTLGPFTVEQHVADATSVLDGVGWESAIVMGHSWGAHLALHLTVAHPTRVAGLVSVDTLGAVGDGGDRALEQELHARLPDHERDRAATLAAGSAQDQQTLMALLWPCWFSRADAAPPAPPLRHNPDDTTPASVEWHLQAGTLAAALPTLDTPALFVHGRHDPLPADASRQSAALMPSASIEVVKTGHFPWIEQPGLLHRLVHDFAADVAV